MKSETLLPKEEYALMAARENFYWWHIGRRKILESVLGRYLPRSNNQILDVGCGGGGNILFLKKYGEVIGLDPSPDALAFCENKGFKELALSGIAATPYVDNFFDLVTAFDVLEHLPDDIAALKEMVRVSKGLVMITVPAWPFLWSAHDFYLGHRRRYRKSELINKFKRAGLEVLESSYFITPAVPAVMVRRFLEKVFHLNSQPHSFDIILPRLINNILIIFLRLEKYWLRLSPLPWGSSLYIIAKKDRAI